MRTLASLLRGRGAINRLPSRRLSMPLSMSQASVPAITQMLNALSAHPRQGGRALPGQGDRPADFIGAQLAPDMFPFARQVQIATRPRQGHRRAAVGPRNPEIRGHRIDLRRAEGADRQDARLREERAGARDRRLGGARGHAHDRRPAANLHRPDAISSHFALPNFFFHVTTAYDILRHKGVEIGKRDFIGAPPQA